MKHYCIYLPAMALLLLTTALPTHAVQGQVFKASTPDAGVPAVNTSVRKSVHIRAVRDFRKKYPEAGTESWYSTANGGFVVAFEQNKVKHLLSYNKSGSWLCDESIYTAGLLKDAVKRQVLDYYEEYLINNVVELQTPVAHVYLVNIQNKDHTRSKTIRISDSGDMDVVSDLSDKP